MKIIAVAVALTGCTTTSKVARDIYHALPFVKESKAKTVELSAIDADATVRTKNITYRLKVTPDVVKLSETRQLTVKLRLDNTSSRFIQLAFPTSQRIEILIRTLDGKVLTQWSEDRSFTPDIGYVGINPGEYVEYETTISTRDLEAGKSYSVYGFFPNFEELKGEKIITPEA
ncbi:MAG TPA: BsuPI-related putative proteinase inhibitor [Chthoniobacteraceae bacterium]|nr:BsuPI-related putative proteinase inhibitor [Chthoniobacteraceae bacterium]